MAVLTRLGLHGGPRSLYGSFAGKDSGAPVDLSGLVTRLGLYGGPRSLYGSFAGKSQPSLFAQCTLVDRNGTTLPGLADLSWAWFDAVDPSLYIAPTDQGDAETTDGSGVLIATLASTTLTVGQSGTLVLRSDSGVLLGAYTIEIT